MTRMRFRMPMAGKVTQTTTVTGFFMGINKQVTAALRLGKLMAITNGIPLIRSASVSMITAITH